MVDKKSKKPELLAPAGSINVFESAIESGADAVYIGAPALNARALSKDFSFAEIAAMIQYAHKRDVKLYLATNSLVKENEIQQTLETLATLDALKPDALIIQDLGVYHLCKKYFPRAKMSGADRCPNYYPGEIPINYQIYCRITRKIISCRALISESH